MKISDQQNISIIGFFLMMIFIISIIVTMIFEKNPLEYKSVPFSMVSKVLKRGEIPSYQVISCNNTTEAFTYSVTQELESLDDDFSITLGESKIVISPGCHSNTIWLFPIPSNVTPGEYRLVGESKVMGLTRTHFTDWYTQPFKVIQ